MDSKLQWIFSRRSVRAYTKEPVAEDAVRSLLEAAMAAPSAMTADPWEFIVVTDAECRRHLADILPGGKMAADAPLVIVVLGDRQRVFLQEESFLLQDVSAATENLLLAAHTLGLGAVWIGVHPLPDCVEGVRARFGLPQHLLPVACVAVGHPAEHHPPRTRYREDAVHREIWSGKPSGNADLHCQAKPPSR